MPMKARRDVVDESTVGAYHVFGRSARQEFLFGVNPSTDWDYGHRKELFLERLKLLESVFAVECCDEDVLDNHFHLLLRNRPDVVATWTDQEVAERWLLLSRSEIALRKAPKRQRVDALVADTARVTAIRRRLSSISWFMAYLREPLARVFNAEDGRAGHFWERFNCVRLEDEESLMACSLYIAMNSVRAGIATSVETSHHASVHARLQDRLSGDPMRPKSGHLAAVHVDGDAFDGVAAQRRPSNKGYLKVTFDEYLEVLVGLIEREMAQRRGEFIASLPPVLERLGITGPAWEAALRLTSRRFSRELERMATIRETAPRRAAGR